MVPISPKKVAGRCALAGFLISILFLVFWLLEDRYNFFNLPTAEQVAAMNHNYSAPPLRDYLERINFVLCPPLVIMFVGMDLGRTANLILEVICLVLNTTLYFALGLAFSSLWNRVLRLKLRAKLSE
jgi:hypothetical protein